MRTFGLVLTSLVMGNRLGISCKQIPVQFNKFLVEEQLD